MDEKKKKDDKKDLWPDIPKWPNKGKPVWFWCHVKGSHHLFYNLPLKEKT